MLSYPGHFITFEGGEGSGKSTQLRRLAKALEEQGHKVLQTREPGGTPDAEKIRDLLVQREGGAWHPLEECLLHYTSRHNHVENLIKPALQDGKIVLCDRFADSTLAYQGYGYGLDVHEIRDLHELVMGTFKPALTFILDIDPERGLKRSERRLAEAGGSKESTEDRYERLDFAFHKRVRTGFRDIADHEPDRCKLLNAGLPIEELAQIIKNAVIEKLEN